MLAVLSASFALLAVLLATIGLYGVIASSVARRTREFGIRMAFGAGRRQILWLVMRDAALIVGAGILLGGLLAGLIPATRAARTEPAGSLRYE